jgi:hypothetical protein
VGKVTTSVVGWDVIGIDAVAGDKQAVVRITIKTKTGKALLIMSPWE